jgi:hypothetical protein
LTAGRGLQDPDVLLAFVLLKLLVVVVEVCKLVRQDVGVRHEVKGRLAVALLHADHVEAEAVFARNFVALWEVVDFLVLVEAFVLEALAGARGPKQVPLVAFGGGEAVVFKY